MTKKRLARQYTVIVKNVVVVIVTFVRDVLKIVAICIIIIVFFVHRPVLASPPPRATYIEASISQSENNPANLKVMLQVQAEPSPSAQIALRSRQKATASVSSLALGSEKRSSREAVPAESLKNLPSVLLRNSLPIPKVDEIVPSALEDTSAELAPEQQGLAPEITSLPRLSGGGSIELSPGGSSFTRPQRTPSLINRRPSSTTFLAAHTSQQSFISESGDRGRRPESQSSSSVFAPQRNTRLQRSMARSEFRRRLCPCLPCFRGTDLQNTASEVVSVTLLDGDVTSTNQPSDFLQETRQEGILRQAELRRFYSTLENYPSTITGEVQLKYVRNSQGKMEVRLQASADSHYGCKVIQDVAKTVFGDKFKKEEYEIEHVRGSRGALLSREEQPCILIRKSMHRAMTNELKETSKLPYDFSATSDTAIDGLARQYKGIHSKYYEEQTEAGRTYLNFPKKTYPEYNRQCL